MKSNGYHIFTVGLPKDHPACDGHFDGNPLLPGVVTLEYVRLALKNCYPKLSVRSLSKAKFTHSLKPGETLYVHLKEESFGKVDFQCFDSKQHQIAIGTLKTE